MALESMEIFYSSHKSPILDAKAPICTDIDNVDIVIDIDHDIDIHIDTAIHT